MSYGAKLNIIWEDPCAAPRHRPHSMPSTKSAAQNMSVYLADFRNVNKTQCNNCGVFAKISGVRTQHPPRKSWGYSRRAIPLARAKTRFSRILPIVGRVGRERSIGAPVVGGKVIRRLLVVAHRDLVAMVPGTRSWVKICWNRIISRY